MMVAMPTRPPARALGRLLLEPEVARVVGVLPVWLDPMVRHLRFPALVGARNGVQPVGHRSGRGLAAVARSGTAGPRPLT